uniref:Uncharacterized protein n=1 Tax=Psilocybe cubensis TaxID=181762 RepID=A0A8H8CPX2_PSICU
MVGVSGDWDTICQNLLLPSSATCVKLSLTVTFTKRDVRTRKALTPIHMEKLQHIHIYVCDPSKVPNFIQRLSAPKLESLHVLCEEAIKPFTWNLNAYYEFLSHCSRTLTDLMLYDRLRPSSFDERPKIPKKPAEDIERLLGVIPYVKTLTLPMTALIHGRTVERIKSKSYIWSLLPNVVSLQASFRNAGDVREMVQSRNAEDSSSQRTSIITSVMARIPRHKGQPRPKKGKEIQGCCEIKWLS